MVQKLPWKFVLCCVTFSVALLVSPFPPVSGDQIHNCFKQADCWCTALLRLFFYHRCIKNAFSRTSRSVLDFSHFGVWQEHLSEWQFVLSENLWFEQINSEWKIWCKQEHLVGLKTTQWHNCDLISAKVPHQLLGPHAGVPQWRHCMTAIRMPAVLFETTHYCERQAPSLHELLGEPQSWVEDQDNCWLKTPCCGTPVCPVS